MHNEDLEKDLGQTKICCVRVHLLYRTCITSASYLYRRRCLAVAFGLSESTGACTAL